MYSRLRARSGRTAPSKHTYSNHTPIQSLGRLRCSARACPLNTGRPWTPLSAVAEGQSEANPAHDAELQRLLQGGPPADFDFRSEVTHSSRQWVQEHAPQLRDLVEDGTLVVVPRRSDYRERRTDGYCEPRVVLLVGTVHVSRRSQRDVDRVIRAVAPDSVVVELCKSRSAALMAPTEGPQGQGEEQQQHQQQKQQQEAQTNGARAAATTPSSTSTQSGSESDWEQGPEAGGGGNGVGVGLPSPSARGYINPMNLAGSSGGGGGGGDAGGGGGGFLGAVARSVSLGGQSALLLRVLLAGLARRTAGSLGVAGGGEFAAARVAAEEVGCQLVLGDRPVEITLDRAWAALPPGRRLKLCGELLAGALGTPRQVLNEELVERLKSDDAVSAFFSQLSTSYPELVSPLITERDLYLAWSLKRSKAVNGAGLVVGVVGRGHLRGVVWALLRDQGGAGLRFTDLVDGRNSRRRRREQAAQGVRRLFIELALGTAAYLAWVAYTQSL